MTKKTLTISGLVLLVIGTLFGTTAVAPMVGSVQRSNEYFSTTTAAFINPLITGTVLTGNVEPVSGALGSIIHTAAGTGVISIYDATTTNSAFRTGRVASSTILLASIPSAAAAGTYTFDAVYKTGLLVVISGTAGTTTITWR